MPAVVEVHYKRKILYPKKTFSPFSHLSPFTCQTISCGGDLAEVLVALMAHFTESLSPSTHLCLTRDIIDLHYRKQTNKFCCWDCVTFLSFGAESALLMHRCLLNGRMLLYFSHTANLVSLYRKVGVIFSSTWQSCSRSRCSHHRGQTQRLTEPSVKNKRRR